MKLTKLLIVFAAAALLLCGCAEAEPVGPTAIELSEEAILVNQKPISKDENDAVYESHDIVYYESGHDFTYGEGTEADAHDAAEAAAHTVINITEPGEYRISGSLQKGQIAVDLGEEAEDDPNAVVTLILDEADITCKVAPAVIFYNVYECTDKESAAADVDTSAAGANILLAEGSENILNGAYVAKIYKEVTLSEDGTEVLDSKKLHKYDGALYSRMSMNIGGEGALTVNAENEGIGSELHLTVNGGDITVNSGNDGINTNEDGVSVTTINGGRLRIRVNGSTGEGDGIDSNGWLVINGGEVYAEACATSGDSGIDSDMGIHLGGGTVVASGTMLDAIAEGGMNYAVFSFRDQQSGMFSLQSKSSDFGLDFAIENGFTTLLVASELMAEGEYTLSKDGTELMVAVGGDMGMMGHKGGLRPEGFAPGAERPELPEGAETSMEERPEKPEGFERPAGERPELPEGEEPWNLAPEAAEGEDMPQPSSVFTIQAGGNYFSVA